MSPCIRLRKKFDPERLQSDLKALCRIKGTPAGYPGEGHISWTSIALIPEADDETPLLDQTPYLRDVLAELNCTYRLARRLVLEPGGEIKEHCDSFLSNEVVRLHLPIVTHPDVEAYVGGQRCDWREGELWYGNFTLPHRAVNRSAITRVHLVLDVIVDATLLDLFPPGDKPEHLRSRSKDAAAASDALKRFAFRFTLPAGFQIPGMPYPPLAQPLPGSVELIQGELIVCINRQPMIKVAPSSDSTLELVGLPFPARIFCQYDGAGTRIESVVLAMGADGPELSLAAAPI